MAHARRAPSPAQHGGRAPATQRREHALRLVPVAVAAIAALVAGLVTGARHVGGAERVAARYAEAWAHGEYASMRALLTPAARARLPLERFAEAHRAAARTATTLRLEVLRGTRRDGDAVVVPMRVRTRIFGTLDLPLRLPIADEGDGPRVAWRPRLTFPGVREGEALRRRTIMPRRASILARDGTPLAEGTARTSPLGLAGTALAGTVGAAPPDRVAALRAAGVPPGAPVGASGFELWLDDELLGRPGGVLRAGRRVLAQSGPVAAPDVRTSLDLRLQAVAEQALGGRLGGVAALRPGSGEVLALAGLAASAAQPPGSTFKIVTLSGVLQERTVRRSARFPVQTETTLEGVTLENANDEACGGTLREAFAHSCNSVFAPLGARLGADALVRTAEAFGFNGPPPLAGAAASTLPPADDIGDDLAVGSTAIGQGRVLATTLHMAWVAATIANRGVRVAPTVHAGERGDARRVLRRDVARYVARAMRAVVEEGTGTAAAIPGVRVAGKTGTAELRTTQVDETQIDPATGADVAPPPEDVTDTDAWFAGFAPARRPRVAVAVLLVEQGAGGTTAAPAARVVLQSALE